MGAKVYDYKTSKYISGSAYFPAIGLLVFGMGCFANSNSIFLGVAALVGLFLILTTHYGLEVNVGNKTFKQYLWIVGFKQYKSKAYEIIEYAFVQSGKVRQNLESVAGFNSITISVYNGYIKFSEKDKIHIIQAKDKETVIRRLQVLATDLNLEIVDFTDDDCVSILPKSAGEQPDIFFSF
ncbi:hypothetical protein [Adhaeribacter pallidiroseus]|uniref:Uncharacterized protein n=1 Tax=Adhaeribacter pallidiroseus TaxID=2072847 RepID=A0A369QJH3_9BACT|nr:hypothetical protein [Adhaeribacter pallidiroseus]RDC63775.1 hypothetical protein AHMF7616_02383 [Adhaeribacter pallidiroseus]